jgi:hypothetical protein
MTAEEHSGLRVDAEQCRQVAKRLQLLQVHPDRYLKRATSDVERREYANYWLYITAICQSTRTFQGIIGGRRIRGWDYLVEASLRRAKDCTAKRMLSYTADDLRSMLSDDLDPAHSPIDRVEERVDQLHDCARRLLDIYQGEAMGIFQRAEGRLSDAGGLLDLLAQFKAYADPMRKKSVLLVGMLHEIDVWPLRDPHNLKVAMDYHAMRVALRSGIVELTDAELSDDLCTQRPVSAERNQAVRAAVSAACDILVAESGLTVFALDKLIWHLGRSCCFYEHDPICGPGLAATCFTRDTCTFVQATTYRCPNACVLDGVCRGSRDQAHRALWETNIYTPDY